MKNMQIIMTVLVLVALAGVCLAFAWRNFKEMLAVPVWRPRTRFGVQTFKRARIRPPRFVNWLFRPIAIALGLLATAVNWLTGAPSEEVMALENAAEDGTHLNGILTKKSDAAIATRYLLVKFGSDGDHVAVAGAADIPIGVCLDEAGGAEEPMAVQTIPCASTIRVITDGGGALVVGDLLIPAAGGKVKKVAAAVGLQFIVGQVLTAPATVDGTPFEAIAKGCWYNTAVS